MGKNKTNFEVEFMNCKSCGLKRIKTKSGLCVICSKTNFGNEIKNIKIPDNHGKEVLSKTGKKDENIYLRG